MKKLLALVMAFVLIATSIGSPSVYAADASDITISQESNVDVVLSVGNSAVNINSFNNDLTQALIAKGVPAERINISSIQAATSSTDTQSASDIVNGWLARPIGVSTTSGMKDTDYAARYTVDVGNNWIASTASSDRPAAVYFDPNGFNIRNATIEYTWGISPIANDFAHGEAGFIFRMDETRNNFYTYTLDNHAACGNLTGFGSDGTAAEAILKFTNGSNSPSSKSPLAAQTAGTNMYATNTAINPAAMKLNDFAIYAQGRKEYIKIELNGNNIKVYRRKNDNSGTDVNALDKQDPYVKIFDWTDETNPFMTGTIGFYVWDQALAYFSDITISTESTRGFAEIIRQPQWRSNAEHFVVNLEDSLIPDFEDSVKLGEILSRMGNEDIHYLGWGTTTNQAQSEAFLDKNDDKGTFTLNSDYAQSIQDMADYIYSVYFSSKESNVLYVDVDKPQELTVTPNEEKYNTTDGSWPNGKWKVTHDPTYFNEDQGLAVFHDQYMDDLDITFTKPGEYLVYYKDVLVKTVRAHRKPFALFNVSVDGSRNVTLTDLSYDLDHILAGNKGITDREYQWKETSSNTWTDGTVATLDANKEYIIRQRVKDEEGQWSKYYNRYVSTNSNAATVKAIPEFLMDKTIVSKAPGIIDVTDISYAPIGATTGTEWTVLKNNSVIYTNATPKEDFSDVTEGVYRIRLRVQNAAGWSDYFIRTLQVIEDDIAPTVTFTPEKSFISQGSDLTLTFDDQGGSGLSYQQAVITADTNAPADYGPKGNASIRALDMSTLGTYYVHYKAVDGAGNTLQGYYGPVTVVTHPDWIDLGEDYDDLVIGYAAGDSASSVTQNVTLPLSGLLGSKVTWSTNASSMIDINGNVFRPTARDGDGTVTLTATLTKGVATTTKQFVLTVIHQPATDEEAVAADKAQLAIGYAAGDNAASVTQNVTLPTTASNGSTVSWSSNTAGTITNAGMVTRPAYNTADQKVTLIATITKNAVTETRTFELTVKKDAMTDVQALAADKAALDVIYALGDNATYVTRDVTLLTSLPNGSTVTWVSSVEGTISTSGTVTRPSNGSGNVAVDLTATITKGAETDTKVFNLTVIELPIDDTAKVAADKAQLAIIYAPGDNVNSITQNVTLITSTGNGSTVSWSSDTPASIDSNGNVTRPANGDGNATVKLTATITNGAVSDTVDFVGNTVIEMPVPVDGTADVTADEAALAIIYGAGDDENHVTLNVGLPLTGGNGSTITWSSDLPSNIDTMGNVFRPSYVTGDTTVTLTATISKNGAQMTKVFALDVIALGGTDKADVVLDKTQLMIGYAPGDAADSVTQDVTLPLIAAKGSTVVWASDAPTVIDTDGKVVRPEANSTDRWVTLTATLSLNGETDTKVFMVLVKAKATIPTPSPEPDPQPVEQKITVNVVQGDNKDAVVSQAVINRVTDPNGTIKDTVNFTNEDAQKTLSNLTGTANKATIIIPDADDSVSQLTVNLSGASLQTLATQGLSLDLQTAHARISIPNSSLDTIDQDLYFRVVPVREATRRAEFENTVLTEQLTLTLASGNTLQLLERPATIETNMSSRPVTLTLPLNQTNVPTDPIERAAFENNLFVFIEHSDGERVILKGKLVTYNETGLMGVEFSISKFSTFALISLGTEFVEFKFKGNDGMTEIDSTEGVVTVHVKKGTNVKDAIASFIASTDSTVKVNGILQVSGVTKNDFSNTVEYVIETSKGEKKVWKIIVIFDYDDEGTHTAYLKGYPDGTFKPQNLVTRGEFAAILSRLTAGVSKTQPNINYSDVNIINWAYFDIENVTERGLMNGYLDSTFRPNQPLSNRELNWVIVKWLGQSVETKLDMNAYTRRVELVTLLNELLGRGPLLGLSRNTWSDVPLTHTNSGDIEEASTNHDYFRSEDGTEMLKK